MTDTLIETNVNSDQTVVAKRRGPKPGSKRTDPAAVALAVIAGANAIDTVSYAVANSLIKDGWLSRQTDIAAATAAIQAGEFTSGRLPTKIIPAYRSDDFVGNLCTMHALGVIPKLSDSDVFYLQQQGYLAEHASGYQLTAAAFACLAKDAETVTETVSEAPPEVAETVTETVSEASPEVVAKVSTKRSRKTAETVSESVAA